MVPTSSDSRSAFVVASESVGGLGNLIGTAPGRDRPPAGETNVGRGDWYDPRAGDLTFAEWARPWMAVVAVGAQRFITKQHPGLLQGDHLDRRRDPADLP